MPTENSTLREMLEDMISHRNVGQQHEFFYHTIGIKHGF